MCDTNALTSAMRWVKEEVDDFRFDGTGQIRPREKEAN